MQELPTITRLLIKIILYLCERESDAHLIKNIEPMEDKSLLGGCYVIRMHDDFEIIDEVDSRSISFISKVRHK